MINELQDDLLDAPTNPDDVSKFVPREPVAVVMTPEVAASDLKPVYVDYYQWWSIQNMGCKYRHIPPEVAYFLKLETEFDLDEDAPEIFIPPHMAGDIGHGGECPHCKNTKRVFRPKTGVTTKLRVLYSYPCPCIMVRNFWSHWSNPKNVGQDYRRVRMANLADFEANFRRFVERGKFDELLKTVQKFPFNSYLLVGPHGLGKTTLLTAFYEQALTSWVRECFDRGKYTEAVFMTHATVLSAEFRNWEMRNDGRGDDEGQPTPVPTVTENKIMFAVKAGFTRCLFIEEIDKFKLDSDFQRKEFYNIIDAVHRAGGQIVATSNLGDANLEQKLGPQYGGGIIRRLVGPRGNEGVRSNEKGVRGKPDPSMGASTSTSGKTASNRIVSWKSLNGRGLHLLPECTPPNHTAGLLPSLSTIPTRITNPKKWLQTRQVILRRSVRLRLLVPKGLSVLKTCYPQNLKSCSSIRDLICFK